MMMYYTIIAGANGVGKTSLYEIIKSSDDLGVRINVDEMVREQGHWWDSLLHIAANRRAMKLIADCIKNKTSFHYESTLPAATTVKQVKKAREAGFQIRMYYIGVEGLDVAMERVNRRMKRGGHGVNETVMRKRFEDMPQNLKTVLPYCDIVSFYDNTVRFRQIAVVKGDKVIDCDHILPKWFTVLKDQMGVS